MSVATATRTNLDVRPLHPLFGAVISGLDLREPLDDDTFAAVLDAFNSYSILVFRGQELTDEQHIAFSKRFGELEKTSFAIASTNPFIYRLSNVDDDGNVLEPDSTKRAFLEVNGRWHTDSSFREIPALGSLLSAKEVPSRDGDTNFASMRVAYEALSESRKQSLEGVRAKHHYAYSLSLFGGAGASQEEKDALPPVEHPLVRTHLPTGKKSLYVSGHIESIVGMPVEEGRLLAKELIDWCTRSEYVYTHKWQRHDLVMWDNRCALHRATAVPAKDKRIMHRTTIAGQGPVI
jgi:alpha-ketoglutarate-dependent 2,4-dichlorophenoxyacetate dioxygenase